MKLAIASFERHFGKFASIIRTIPNTPASIGRGITAMSANANVSAAQLNLAKDLLSAIGEVVTVDREELIDSETAVSGSGPAYVFYLTECLAAAGEKVGLPPALAMQLARATVAVGTASTAGGQLDFSHCSGVLIGADLVLTAAHCVRCSWPTTGWLRCLKRL